MIKKQNEKIGLKIAKNILPTPGYISCYFIVAVFFYYSFIRRNMIVNKWIMICNKVAY